MQICLMKLLKLYYSVSPTLEPFSSLVQMYTLQIGGCGAEQVTQTERKKHSVKRDQLSPVLHQCYKLWVTWKTPCMSSCISPVLQLRISDAIFSICILSSESERPNCWLPRYRFWRDSTAVFSWNEERTVSGKLIQSNCATMSRLEQIFKVVQSKH